MFTSHREHAMNLDQLSLLHHHPLFDLISQSRAVHLQQAVPMQNLVAPFAPARRLS
jgi:hypothetical protein